MAVRGKHANDFRGGDARSHFIHRGVTHYRTGIENEHGGFGNASFFARVVHAPLARHAAKRVA